MKIKWVSVGSIRVGITGEAGIGSTYCYLITPDITERENCEVLTSVSGSGKTEEIMRLMGNRAEAIEELKRRSEDHLLGPAQ